VPFAAGELRAVAYASDGTTAVANRTLRTAGAAHRVILTADRPALQAHRDDLAYVTATVVDAAGVTVPAEHTLLSFSLDAGAPAEIAAVGSGDPTDSGSFHSSSRKTYRGRAVAIVRPGGTNVAATAGSATLTASADGLASGSVTITFA
jgi:beta-galactosidase